MAETISISLNEVPLNASPQLPTRKSVNFGPGADLLMNHHRKSNPSSPKSDLGLSELNNITLDDVPNASRSAPPPPTRGSLFATATKSVDNKEPIKLNINNIGKDLNKPSILKSSSSEKNGKTWDGYGKFNNIPVDPTKNISAVPKLSKDKALLFIAVTSTSPTNSDCSISKSNWLITLPTCSAVAARGEPSACAVKAIACVEATTSLAVNPSLDNSVCNPTIS